MMTDYEKLKALLELEDYPHTYVHKFIGSKTQAFVDAVVKLERDFPNAERTGERETSDKKGAPYIAYTFELVAESPSEIIELLKATSDLPDLKIIL